MMLSKFVLKCAAFFLCWFCSNSAARAQARLMAQRAFSSEEAKPLEIKSRRAEVNIVDTLASVKLDYTFRNPYNERLEAIYALPLPNGAVVTELSLWEDGRMVTSTTDEGASAGGSSGAGFGQEGTRHQLDPQLAGVLTPGGFNVRLFPIKPLSEWRITLTYHQVVPFEGGKFRFALPWSQTSGQAVPVGTLALQGSLSSRSKIINALAPGYTPQPSTVPGQSTFTWQGQNIAAPAFNLSYSFQPRPLSVATTARQPGGYDYFLMQLLAPSATPIVPDRVILLVDTSGSMRGEKLAWSRAVANKLVQNLGQATQKKQLHVLAFHSEARRLAEPFSPAIEALQAGGGSDVQSALWQARSFIRATDRNIAVVLISDGQATLGSRSLAQLKPALQVEAGKGPTPRKLRFYALHVGDDAQSTLSGALVDATGGAVVPVQSLDDANKAAAKLMSSFGGSVWSNILVQLAGNRPLELYPRNPSTVLAGASTFVLGRSPGLPRNAVVSLVETRTGRAAALRPELPPVAASQSTLVAPSPNLAQMLPALWAQQKVDYLLGEMNELGRSDEVEEQIAELSARYRLVNSYTSAWVVAAQNGEPTSAVVGPPGPAGPPGPMGPPGLALPPIVVSP